MKIPGGFSNILTKSSKKGSSSKDQETIKDQLNRLAVHIDGQKDCIIIKNTKK